MSILEKFTKKVESLKTKKAIAINKKEEIEIKLKKHDVENVDDAIKLQKKLTKESKESNTSKYDLEEEINEMLEEYEE